METAVIPLLLGTRSTTKGHLGTKLIHPIKKIVIEHLLNIVLTIKN